MVRGTFSVAGLNSNLGKPRLIEGDQLTRRPKLTNLFVLNRKFSIYDVNHSRTQSPSYARSTERDKGLWPNPYQTGI